MVDSEHIGKKASLPFFILAAAAFILTGIFGFTASIVTAFGEVNHDLLPFEKIRPLHTLFAIVGVLAGLHGWVCFMTVKRSKKKSFSLSVLGFSLLLLFTVGAGLSLFFGKFSGREYFSWPTVWSVPLILSLLILIYLLCKTFSHLYSKSPEGFWLVGFGVLFILIGQVESALWLVSHIGNNYVRDLTVQWHGIDTFFAGLNAFSYGIGVFVLQKDPKPLRKKWLYAIAVFSLLFTFGHHHYVSPQPHFLKILAFIASMIAMFSFVKHLRAYRRKSKERTATKSANEALFGSVELWTVVSFGSGILFAIPQLNLIIHGTYLIVIHAMGSMIGVQMMLVFTAGFSIFKPVNQKSVNRIKLGVRLTNISLILMWILMGITGLIKGIMRFDYSYYEINSATQYSLYFLPVLGSILLVALYLLSSSLIISSVQKNKDVVSTNKLVKIYFNKINNSLKYLTQTK